MPLLILPILFVLSYWLPRAGAALLLLLLPSYLIKFELFGIPTTLLELSTYVVASALFTKLFFAKDWRREVKEKLKWLLSQRSLLLVVFLFFAAAVLATIFTWDTVRSMGILKGWFFDPILFAFILFLTLRNRLDWYRGVVALSLMAAALSAWGLGEYWLRYDPYTTIGDRLFSVFTSPNYFALLVGPVIVLSVSVLTFARDFWRRSAETALLLITTVINLFAFYLTYSYGGFVGLAAGLTVVLIPVLWLSNLPRRGVYALVALFVALISVTAIINFSSAKFQRDFFRREGLSSFRGRAEVWQTGFAIIKRHPVFGVGLGNYDEAYKKYVREAIGREPLEPVMIHAHNIFLDFWTDMGLIGLLAFLVLLAYFFRAFWQAKNINRALAFGAFGGMITVLGHGLLDTPYFKNDLSYLFWFIITVIVYLNYERGKVS